jgi:hypothetical protein
MAHDRLGRVQLLGLLAEPQLGDLVRARRVQVGGEHPVVAGMGETDSPRVISAVNPIAAYPAAARQFRVCK